jgi:sugar O-acyltransferase (sialic acid O-acetyltransferase NeuD family)
MKRLAILGASGHGKVVAEIAELNGFTDVVFFDDAWTGKDGEEKWSLGFPWRVVGNTESLISSHEEFDACIMGIGHNVTRLKKQSLLKESGVHFIPLIHPSATVSSYAEVGEGTVVMANVVVNPFAKIGSGCILNSGATIDHDCILGEGVHVSPGANLGGGVEIGCRSWIGVGSCVRQYLKIGSGVIVGGGAVVVKDVPDHQTVVGVPARALQ